MYFLLVFLVVFKNFIFLEGHDKNVRNSSHYRISREIYENHSPPNDSQIQSYFSTEEKTTSTSADKYFSKKNLKSRDTSQPFQPLAIYDKNSVFYEPSSTYGSSKNTVSHSNADQSVWKGKKTDSAVLKSPSLNSKVNPSQSSFEYLTEFWNNSPWTAEKMAILQMMMKKQQKNDSSPILGGLWSSLKKEPSTFLLVSAIPITILLGAILPTLVKNMNKVGPSAVITSAIGNKAREFIEDGFISPIFNGISEFGEKALENPMCIQRILCEVTKDYSLNSTDSTLLVKVLLKTSSFIDESYLRSFGIRVLLDSMADGNCAKVPCLNFNLTEYILKFLNENQ
ncbi:uncharacterized protein NPIL_382301 [Nephila pilipes]|uniref:Uncharacterized protein n=1 Tax=Nephila pilipes TaxID=299642 RepID=A0A8X6UG03_NEPPI|nr:uncharacterized protein NPIL_382301 [Nephila pilipes]